MPASSAPLASCCNSECSAGAASATRPPPPPAHHTSKVSRRRSLPILLPWGLWRMRGGVLLSLLEAASGTARCVAISLRALLVTMWGRMMHRIAMHRVTMKAQLRQLHAGHHSFEHETLLVKSSIERLAVRIQLLAYGLFERRHLRVD